MNIGFIVTLTGQVLIALQGLLVVPIIVKWAGAPTYGMYVLLGNIISVSFSVLAAMQYLYHRRLVSAASVAERRAVMEPQLTFHLIGISVIGSALAFATEGIERLLFGDPNVVSWWVLVAWLATVFVAKQVQDYYRFILRFWIFSFSVVSSLYLFLALSIVWALAGNVLSVNVLFLFQIAATLAVHLPFVVMMISELGTPRLRLPAHGLGGDLYANLPFVSSMIVDFILGFSDRYLIAFFVSLAAVAAYQPAYQLASLLLFIPRFAIVLLEPGVSKMIDDGNRAMAEHALQLFMKFFLMMAFPFVTGSLMLGASIVALLTTPEVGEAGRWVPALVSVGVVFYGLMLTFEPVALALGRNGALLVAYAGGASVNLALNLALLPLFRNIHVAAMTTVAGYAVGCLWMWRIFRAHWEIVISRSDVLRYLMASAVMGLVLFVLGFSPTVAGPSNLLSLIGSVAIGVVVYFVALSAFGGFGRKELTELNALRNFGGGSSLRTP